VRTWTLEGPGLADPKKTAGFPQVDSQVPAGQARLVACPSLDQERAYDKIPKFNMIFYGPPWIS